MRLTLLVLIGAFIAPPSGATRLDMFVSLIEIPGVFADRPPKMRYIASVTVTDISPLDRASDVFIHGELVRYGNGGGSCSNEIPMTLDQCNASAIPHESIVIRCSGVPATTCETGHSLTARARALTTFNLVSSFCKVAPCSGDVDGPSTNCI